MAAKARRGPRPPKRPKRPKRPPRVPPRPDTPKIPKRKPRPVYRPRWPKPRGDELTRYLAANPRIAAAIKWSSQASSAWQPYPTWSPAQQAQLRAVYWRIRRRQFQGLSATPIPTYLSSGMWEGVTAGVGVGFDEPTAWEYFLAYVAQCLVAEIAKLVPWSLKAYSVDQLNWLLTTNGLFSYYQNVDKHLVYGGVTPGDPVRIYRFLANSGFVALNRRDTIGRLLDWCRRNMRHWIGSFDPVVAQAYWQYNGYPPVERVISGTTHPQYGSGHWTLGCGGTSAFLAIVLRTVNIPVKTVSADGHATPHFMSENLYLSHGDDPYDGLLTRTPPVPIDELFIDQNKFTTWFDWNLPQQTQQDNVGRRCIELALQYLTDWIVRLRCKDLAQGVPNPASSSVYNDTSLKLYKFYTVSDLQAMNLWGQLDAKIAAGGGCSSLFPSPITAAITAPASGSTVSGSVTVTMTVSGQTAPVNTFKLEVQGNPIFNQTVTGASASFTWDTTVWTNGPRTLKLTVTDSAGSTATATLMVTISNTITAAITAPAAGSTVSGSVTVTMGVSGHTVPLNLFNLKIDGNQVFNQLVAGLSATYAWDTTTVANGPHTLTLTVTDSVSKTATASSSIDVAN